MRHLGNKRKKINMKKTLVYFSTIICGLFCCIQSVKGFEKDIHTVGLWNLDEGKCTVLHDTSGNDLDFHLSIPVGKKDAPKPKWVITPGGKGLLFRTEDGRQFGDRPNLCV
jgi:hypothetical protein